MARILIVDDDVNLLKMVKLMLERAGHEVETTASGDEGLTMAAQAQPELAIIDVMMPGLSGYDVVRKLRANPHTFGIPIIILTARSQPMDKQMALDAGANAFMSKPVTSQELIERVDAVLRHGVGVRVHTGLLTEPMETPQAGTPVEPRTSPPVTQAASQVEAPVSQRPVTAPLPILQPAPAPFTDDSPGRLPILAVAGLRGGTGTTTTAINLACLLASRGRRVCIIDLSTSSGHAPLHLHLVPQQKHWGQLLGMGDGVDVRALSKLLIQHKQSGIALLAAPLIPAMQSLTAAATHKILNELGGVFQHVVVDVPNLDPATISTLHLARSVVMVMSDDPPAVQTTAQFLVTLQNLSVELARVRVALNHVRDTPDVGTETIQKALKRPISAEIPYDSNQLQAFRRGIPLVMAQPDSPFAKGMQQLARTLIM